MELNLPEYVIKCLEKLEYNGFEAWCVGGAVRDLIMGKNPYDYDITTNADPEMVFSLFPKTVPTGIKHGTVTVITEMGNIEVTTYRSDGDYLDNRSPENVRFVKSIDEDLIRRDFTVNSICYNPKKGIYDPLNGIQDINSKIIRAIGDPDIRFTEDALRIMRAFRFSAQLGFEIEKLTLTSAVNLSDLLNNISVERIFCEFKRIITSSNPEKLSPLLKCCAFEFLMLKQCEIPDILKHLTNDFSLRFSVMCYKNEFDAVEILKKMKSDSITINIVKILSKLLTLNIPRTKADIKRMLEIGGIECFRNILNYYHAIGIDITELNDLLKQIIENNEPYSIKMLAVSGNDLLQVGISGQEVGKTLNYLKNIVIEHSDYNTKEYLLNLIKK